MGRHTHDTIYVDGDPNQPVSVNDEFSGNGGATKPYDHEFMRVINEYFDGHPDYVDRGMRDHDLVDVLDGMMCEGTLTQAKGASLLWTTMGFDYDFQPDCL